MTSGERSDLPYLSVIVPHYQDLAGLKLCLASIDAQTYPPERFEVVLADNNSPVGPVAVEQVVAGRATVVVVTEKGAGPARTASFRLELTYKSYTPAEMMAYLPGTERVDSHTIRYRAASIVDISRFLEFAMSYRSDLTP